MLELFFAVCYDGAIDIPSVIVGACLSVRGAAVTIPAMADRAMMDCESFMLVEK